MRRPLTPSPQKSPKESEQDRDTFLAMVSHELRTPTAAILGWASLLEEEMSNEKTLAHGIKVIERNARLQEQLIEQLIEFSRVSNGCLRLDAQKVSLVHVLEAAIDTMLPQVKAKSVDLDVNLDRSIGEVIGDPIRLQQVVTNVLANAIKFTPSGGFIDIRLVRRGGYAEVTVSDTGRGIAPEFLPYIFDPFRQAEADKPYARGGLGLGLAIARHIIERHNGKIFADSCGEGKGTTFTVSIPLEDGDDRGKPEDFIAAAN